MRDRTRLELIAESNKIYRSLVWWIAVLVIAIIAMIRPATMKNEWLFVAVLSATIVAFVAIGLNVLRVNGLGDDEPEPPRFDTSSLFESSIGQPITRLEARTKDNQLRRCTYDFSPGQWLKLVHALKINDWVWSRDYSVRKADIFNATNTPGTSLTRAADWRKVCAEFERLNVIRKRGGSWVVTDEGRESLCAMANLRVVI